MRLKSLWLNGFKNLNGFDMSFEGNDGITVIIGNNGSGKSNILEAISAIFAGLYRPSDSKRKPGFDYKIEYEIRGNTARVEYIGRNYSLMVNGQQVSNAEFFKSDFVNLPSQVIASYSGEEDRLWDKYYKPYYDEFIDGVMRTEQQAFPDQKLFYVNKYYWDIALLTFLYSDKFRENDEGKQFISDLLELQIIDPITIEFNLAKLKRYKSNVILEKIRKLNLKNEPSVNITLSDLLDCHNGYEKDFFTFFSAVCMPKEDKLISNIDIKFTGGLTRAELSEGEKKYILIKVILEYLADENSLVLLDEPDSHIHISRKELLKKLFDTYNNRSNILTTHSPTLAHCFDINKITMLTKTDKGDVRVEKKEKQEIIYELTEGIWSAQEQNIFLASNKDLILVEGITDINYIKTALSKLKTVSNKFINLDFEYLPFGGADGLRHFIDKFTPAPNQKVIALLDRDNAGLTSLKKVLNDNNIDINIFKYRKVNNMYISLLPVKPRFTRSNYVIEDYFDIKTLCKFITKDAVSFDTIRNKDKMKTALSVECTNFDSKVFKGFGSLFDYIISLR